MDGTTKNHVTIMTLDFKSWRGALRAAADYECEINGIQNHRAHVHEFVVEKRHHDQSPMVALNLSFSTRFACRMRQMIVASWLLRHGSSRSISNDHDKEGTYRNCGIDGDGRAEGFLSISASH